jgi:hypothetical protein
MEVAGYIRQQIEYSERLFNAMKEDASKRQNDLIKHYEVSGELVKSFMTKLNERDEEIKKLREELRIERERKGYKKEAD